MEKATDKGRVIALTQVKCSGIEVMPGGMPRAGGAYHAMDVAISGQPVTMSGQNVNVTSGNVQISGVVLISGRVDLATKIAGEDIENDVLKVVRVTVKAQVNLQKLLRPKNHPRHPLVVEAVVVSLTTGCPGQLP